MSAFVTPLDMRFHTTKDKTKRFQLIAPLKFMHTKNVNGHSIVLGFVTVPKFEYVDGASSPRLLWNIIPPWNGLYGKATVIHDYLTRMIRLEMLDSIYDNYYHETKPPTRKDADDMFLDAMIALRVPRWKRYTMYKACRLYSKTLAKWRKR